MSNANSNVIDNAQAQVESTQPTSSSTPCTCIAGCPKCVPSLAQAKAVVPARNTALKAMRSALPAKGLLDTMVLASVTPKVQRRAGSKASACVAYYTVGATVKAIVDSMPIELQAYGRACLVWDYQHGYASFTA